MPRAAEFQNSNSIDSSAQEVVSVNGLQFVWPIISPQSFKEMAVYSGLSYEEIGKQSGTAKPQLINYANGKEPLRPERIIRAVRVMRKAIQTRMRYAQALLARDDIQAIR